MGQESLEERLGGLSNGDRKAEESTRSGPVKGGDRVPRSGEFASAKVLGRESAPLLRNGVSQCERSGRRALEGHSEELSFILRAVGRQEGQERVKGARGVQRTVRSAFCEHRMCLGEMRWEMR